MAEKYLFFNSTLEDRRKHQASDIAEYWDSFLKSGVIHTDGNPTLRVVTNGENMKVNIDPGKAILLGHLYINDSLLEKEIKQATATGDRFDRLVLRLDLNIENRFIKVFVKEGTELAPPDLTREGNIYEVSLAQIHVRAGKNYLEQSDIVDERLDEELCGLASSLVTVPVGVFEQRFETYMQKIKVEWQQWFNSIVSDTYVTNTIYHKDSRLFNKQFANLNAIADIDNKAIGNIGKFYDLFDGSNNYSVAKKDNRRALMNSAVDDSSILPITKHNFKVGEQIEIIGVNTISKVEEFATILSVEYNQIEINKNITILAGGIVARSKNESEIISDWSNPINNPETILPTSIIYDRDGFSLTDDGKYMYPGKGTKIYKKVNGEFIEHMTVPVTFNSGINASITNDGKYIVATSSTVSPASDIYKVDLEEKTSKTLAYLDYSGTQDQLDYQMSQFSLIYKDDVFTFIGRRGDTHVVRAMVNAKDELEITRHSGITGLSHAGAMVYHEKSDSYVVHAGIYNLKSIKKDENGLFYEHDSIKVPPGYALEILAFYTNIDDDHIYIPTKSTPVNKKPLILKWTGAEFVFVEDIFEDGAIVGNNCSGNITMSPDGIYMWHSLAKSIYIWSGEKFKKLYTSPLTMGISGFYGNEQKLFYTENNILKLMDNTSEFSFNPIWRYTFNQPITNLAGWLYSEKQIADLKVSLSLVGNTIVENYKPLAVIQKNNEYEFLETENLYMKEKGTLKIEMENGVKVDKILGGVE